MLARQHGVVHVRQLREFAITRGVLQANLDARRWQRVVRGVYATFTGPLTHSAKVAAALLYGGPTAMLSHTSAADRWQGKTEQRRPAEVEITVAYGRSAISQLPLVKVHRSRAIRHIGAGNDPERTRRVDTLTDLAVAEPSVADATTMFIGLAGRWPVTVRQLGRNLEVRPPYRYRKALNGALRLVASGLMSELEREYLELVERAHGIPPARRQQPFLVDDRILYEDATYDHLGALLTVRLDSRTWHAMPWVAFRDRRRDNAAELAGRSRLTYGWNEVHTDPCGVAEEVISVLRRSGVLFLARRCPRCTVNTRAEAG